MSAWHYYNEYDEYAAQWIVNLIDAKMLPAGEVDVRSIVEVQCEDLEGFTQCHFFAGIGGWPLAARLAGWPDDRELWTGSCPCQPFSAIGKRQGTKDERHLWPEMLRLIRDRRPEVVFGEQVASDDGLEWLDGVWADMEEEGYSFDAVDLCAAGVGAPHIRQRLYWVGHSECKGLEGHSWHVADGGESKAIGSNTQAGRSSIEPSGVDEVHVLRRLDVRDPRRARGGVRLPSNRRVEHRPIWSEFDALACSDGWRRVRPGSFPMAHGIPARVGRLRAYGNAIVPQLASEVIRAFMECRP